MRKVQRWTSQLLVTPCGLVWQKQERQLTKPDDTGSSRQVWSHSGDLHPGSNALEDQRRILRSKSYAVTDSVVDPCLSARVWHVVQITVGIRHFEIDIRWKLTLFHRNKRGRNSCGSTGPLRVTDLRLQR